MMALNIAVPSLTTVGDLMDSFGLLSPISPLSVDCCGVATAGSLGKKELVSPVGSESSGVSSLDSDDTKVSVMIRKECWCRVHQRISNVRPFLRHLLCYTFPE